MGWWSSHRGLVPFTIQPRLRRPTTQQVSTQNSWSKKCLQKNCLVLITSSLEIQGINNDNKIIVGGFKSVSGMDSETEIVEFKQGNDMVVRKKPGRTTYANIVLERGYTAIR